MRTRLLVPVIGVGLLLAAVPLWAHHAFAAEFDINRPVVLRGTVTKWLVTNPSLSPENRHPFGAAVCGGPTMDSQIIRELFSNCIEASEILGADAQFRKQLGAARAASSRPSS